MDILVKTAVKSTQDECGAKNSLPLVDDLHTALDLGSQVRRPSPSVKIMKSLVGSGYLLIDIDMNNVHLSFQQSILASICHNSAKSSLQMLGVP